MVFLLSVWGGWLLWVIIGFAVLAKLIGKGTSPSLHATLFWAHLWPLLAAVLILEGTIND